MQSTSRLFFLPSPVGYWAIATRNECLLSVDFAGDALPASAREEAQGKLEMRIECMLSRYFRGEAVDFTRLPIVFPDETTFLSRVMKVLLSIPTGQVHTYQWAATQLGIPKGAQAIGQAVGRNPIPIIVPCHRIIAGHGRIGGFMRGHPQGGRIKRFLLELEGHTLCEDRLLFPKSGRNEAVLSESGLEA